MSMDGYPGLIYKNDDPTITSNLERFRVGPLATLAEGFRGRGNAS